MSMRWAAVVSKETMHNIANDQSWVIHVWTSFHGLRHACQGWDPLTHRQRFATHHIMTQDQQSSLIEGLFDQRRQNNLRRAAERFARAIIENTPGEHEEILFRVHDVMVRAMALIPINSEGNFDHEFSKGQAATAEGGQAETRPSGERHEATQGQASEDQVFQVEASQVRAHVANGAAAHP